MASKSKSLTAKPTFLPEIGCDAVSHSDGALTADLPAFQSSRASAFGKELQPLFLMTPGSTALRIPLDEPLASSASMPSVLRGGSGSGGPGIGGGGGSPGGGTPGGGGGSGGSGGRPGGEAAGNNLSFPAIFPVARPMLRGAEEQFSFGTPSIVSMGDGYVYFAQNQAANTWQASSFLGSELGISTANPLYIDSVNIGDALESAPIKQGQNVRLELTLLEAVVDPSTTYGFAMTLLEGAKGGGKSSTKGPTEVQGARFQGDPSKLSYPVEDSAANHLGTTTYTSDYASVYAASGSGAEGDSYVALTIQKVEGLDPAYVGEPFDPITGFLNWDGTAWIDGNLGDDITVGGNLSSVAFAPELTVSGTYNVGASGKPWKFTQEGTYLVTFAIKNDSPIALSSETTIINDGSTLPGFQPLSPTEGRLTQVIGDGINHNGLLAMVIGVPSTVGGGETAMALI